MSQTFTPPLVISLNFSSPRYRSSQPRSRTGPQSPPHSAQPDPLLSSLQLQVQRLTAQVSSLTQANSTLQTQVLRLQAQLTQETKTAESESTVLTDLRPLAQEWKALETKLLQSVKDLKKRTEANSRRVRGLEDELRDAKRDLETASRANRLLRIELNTLKETLPKHFQPSALQLAELTSSQLQLEQLRGEVKAAEGRFGQRERELLQEVERVKEKSREMHLEMLELEGKFFICQVEKEVG